MKKVRLNLRLSVFMLLSLILRKMTPYLKNSRGPTQSQNNFLFFLISIGKDFDYISSKKRTASDPWTQEQAQRIRMMREKTKIL